MAAVSLFWNTNMAAVTSCENALKVLNSNTPSYVNRHDFELLLIEEENTE